MAHRFEVPVEKLSWRCDLSFLPFTCTAEMTPLEDFIGQDRAIRAIQFGLGVNKPGFNILLPVLRARAKPVSLRRFLKKPSERAWVPTPTRSPEDWCYVYNFTDADRPQAMKIRRGWGKVLKSDMEQLVQYLTTRSRKCSRATNTRTNAKERRTDPKKATRDDGSR